MEQINGIKNGLKLYSPCEQEYNTTKHPLILIFVTEKWFRLSIRIFCDFLKILPTSMSIKKSKND